MMKLRSSGRAVAAVLTALLGGMAAGPAAAACAGDADVAALAATMLAGTPSIPPAVATIAEGLCTQAKLVALLEPAWGAPVGYKAGLTNPVVQARFGVAEPVRGVLLAGMLREDGTTLPAAAGALPRYEADLVAVVADAGLNQATTAGEVLAHLSALHPFLEVADLVVADPTVLTGPVITAINVGARTGVLGAAIPVRSSPDLLTALAEMTVTMTDQTGRELAASPGSAVLGHPLNAVLWLRKSGITFKAGDLISVGSFGPLLPPKPGLTVTVTYRGLPGDPTVRVNFR